jgi:hypothetical protein
MPAPHKAESGAFVGSNPDDSHHLAVARLIGDARSMQLQQKITLGEMRECAPTRLII